MEKLQIFIQLTRLNKPIGFLLLFWPCVWGLTLGFYFNNEIELYIKYIILFFLGSVLMRSAGCIVNDIIDRKYDKKVERTKDRPLASGKVSVKLALFYTIFLCFFAFLVLINFNIITIILALVSMPLAFTYPLMKRFTYWPQLFLGVTFNWGVLLAFSAHSGTITLSAILLYMSGIFWTLFYDTIYAYQDTQDDALIGVKSTARLFGDNPRKWLSGFVVASTSLCILAIIMVPRNFFFLEEMVVFVGAILFGLHLFYQLTKLNTQNSETCLQLFKSNKWSGLIMVSSLFFAILYRHL